MSRLPSSLHFLPPQLISVSLDGKAERMTKTPVQNALGGAVFLLWAVFLFTSAHSAASQERDVVFHSGYRDVWMAPGMAYLAGIGFLLLGTFLLNRLRRKPNTQDP